jgi:Kef-type K+ transport system membrane component KefB
MLLLTIAHTSLPIQDPVLKFLLELIIILAAPLLLNKIKVPHLLGLIIAGAVVGPNGFNLLARDSSVVVTGTTGLLYIMFMAGLEIDMGDFKKNKWKSLGFSIYTFTIPFVLGLAGGYYLLGFPLLTTILFASLFSSHTLIAYPLVSKLGIAKKVSVNITVGGTMITDILSLLVLAVIVGMAQGDVGSSFWMKLGISMVIFAIILLFVFPVIGRWFFKQVDDKVSQYIFVLVIIYLAALLAEMAGIEAIIGAFFAGLALNKLIPHASTLMNRVEFVGSAIFIPFFLISVGMLVDFKVFFKSWETIGVAAVMLVASIGGKYLAAIATQKTFRFTKDEGQLIFGMSTASAAATLASVMVGYNIILSENAAGEPVRLLNEHVLNGSILLILVSCTVSSFISMSSAQRMAETQTEETLAGGADDQENILLAVSYGATVEKMVNLGLLIRAEGNTNRLFALHVINENKDESSEKQAEKLTEQAVNIAAAADVELQPLIRYDNDIVEGIGNVVKEKKITDLVIGLQQEKGLSASFAYHIRHGYLQQANVNLLIYHAMQPIATLKSYRVLIPAYAEQEAGFFHALLRIWNIARNSGTLVRFYVHPRTQGVLTRIRQKAAIEAELISVQNWQEAREEAMSLDKDECLILFMSKVGSLSYQPYMEDIPGLLNQQLADKNYLLIYPFSAKEMEPTEKRSPNNHRDFAEIGELIGRIFK